MKGQRTEIWKKEEYSYEGAHGFIPVMVSYMPVSYTHLRAHET